MYTCIHVYMYHVSAVNYPIEIFRKVVQISEQYALTAAEWVQYNESIRRNKYYISLPLKKIKVTH